MKKKIIGVIIGIMVLGWGYWSYWQDKYVRHNYEALCMNCHHFTAGQLEQYAETNDGWYPKDKMTPYDSFAELMKTPKCGLNIFCGHGGMKGKTSKTWKEKGTITEESTCFRYNEGLNTNDPDLALVYYFKPTFWQCDSFKGNILGRSVLRHYDSHFNFLPEAEFRVLQEQTLKYIKDNNRVSPEKYKMLEEQYRKTLGVK